MKGRPCKLNAQQAVEIKCLYFDGGMTGKELAAKYGVSVATIYKAIHGTYPKTTPVKKPRNVPVEGEVITQECA